MPELPEVQTVVNDLIRHSIEGKKVVKTVVFWSKSIAEPFVDEFIKMIEGQIIKRIERRGKYICLKMSEATLLIHLRMSGRLILANESSVLSHERVQLILDDGQVLKFIDQRKFGRFYLLRDPTAKLERLGVDPLTAEFTVSCLDKLCKRKKKIKTLLLDQSVISGLGNIYVDEALWLAHIHPETSAALLTFQEIDALHQAIQKILQAAIANQGTSLGEHTSNFHSLNGESGKYISRLNVYKRQGMPCLRCKTVIVKMTLGGRGTHLCPQCQVEKYPQHIF